MKNLKDYYLKEAKSALTQLTNLVNELDSGPYEVQQIRSAANQAAQTASDLNRLCGIVEHEYRQK